VKYFLDTSSLVKIYHKEQGSEIVIDLYNLKVTLAKMVDNSHTLLTPL